MVDGLIVCEDGGAALLEGYSTIIWYPYLIIFISSMAVYKEILFQFFHISDKNDNFASIFFIKTDKL